MQNKAASATKDNIDDSALPNTNMSSLIELSTDGWNKLPHSVINAENLNVFKNRLDIHWGEHRYKDSKIIGLVMTYIPK